MSFACFKEFENIKTTYEEQCKTINIQPNDKVIAKLKKARTRYKLSFRNLQLSDAQIQAIVETMITHDAATIQWKSIVFKNNKITDQGCEPIAKLVEHFPLIYRMDLSKNEITPVGAQKISLAGVKRNEELSLNLFDNKLSKDDIKELNISKEDNLAINMVHNDEATSITEMTEVFTEDQPITSHTATPNTPPKTLTATSTTNEDTTKTTIKKKIKKKRNVPTIQLNNHQSSLRSPLTTPKSHRGPSRRQERHSMSPRSARSMGTPVHQSIKRHSTSASRRGLSKDVLSRTRSNTQAPKKKTTKKPAKTHRTPSPRKMNEVVYQDTPESEFENISIGPRTPSSTQTPPSPRTPPQQNDQKETPSKKKPKRYFSPYRKPRPPTPEPEPELPPPKLVRKRVHREKAERYASSVYITSIPLSIRHHYEADGGKEKPYEISVSDFDDEDDYYAVQAISLDAAALHTISFRSDIFRYVVYLNLSNNMLSKLPSARTMEKCLPQIEYLDLRTNQLESLMSLSSLFTLKQLDVANNAVSSMAGLEQLTSLEVLDISYNPIQTLQGIRPLTMCKQLVNLNVVGCPFLTRPMRQIHPDKQISSTRQGNPLKKVRVLIYDLLPHLVFLNGTHPPRYLYLQRQAKKKEEALAAEKAARKKRKRDTSHIDLGRRVSILQRYERDRQKSIAEHKRKKREAKKKANWWKKPPKNTRQVIEEERHKRAKWHQLSTIPAPTLPPPGESAYHDQYLRPKRVDDLLSKIKDDTAYDSILRKASPRRQSSTTLSQPGRLSISDVVSEIHSPSRTNHLIVDTSSDDPLAATTHFQTSPPSHKINQPISIPSVVHRRSFVEPSVFHHSTDVDHLSALLSNSTASLTTLESPRDASLVSTLREDLAATYTAFHSLTELLDQHAPYSEVASLKQLLSDCGIFDAISPTLYSSHLSDHVKSANRAKSNLLRLFDNYQSECENSVP